MTGSFTLRPLDPGSDAQAVVDLLNTHFLEPVTPEAWQHERQQELARGDILREVVAVEGSGRLVGYARVKREYGTWDPGRLNLWVFVSPDVRNRGLGTRLYEDGMAFVMDRQAEKLDTSVLDDDAPSLAFAEHRGFQLDLHTYGSQLDVQAFDESAFAGVIEAAEATGIRFFSMSDLGNTPEAQRKLYELNKCMDAETPGERVFPSFEEFSQIVYQSEWYVPEGQIIAADGDRWIGMCAVGYFPRTESMHVMILGVDNAYRGRKIGLALKLLSHRVAKALGVKHLKTGNASQNTPILAMNQKLGYKKMRGTYQMQKQLKS
ncbi:MAG: GNAT family N-acetyltransferase [Chloroflexota bacterium]|nr:GNAT family N-acetyltransferase [Chloroflexota bacterium]MDQ5866631.1 GNAT family N-acetyltransferase [Chloroflexota bacterium]